MCFSPRRRVLSTGWMLLIVVSEGPWPSLLEASDWRTLKSFGVIGAGTGGSPSTPLVRGPDGTLYGTTQGQGPAIGGSIIKLDPVSGTLTVLKFFPSSDQGGPLGGLVVSDDTIYGTRRFGSTGFGTIFRMKTDGSDFSVVRDFQSSLEGGNPSGELTLSGNTLFGTTERFGERYTGQDEGGTVFRVNTDGSGFQVLHSFAGTPAVPGDGANPRSGVIFSEGTLFGTTPAGGQFGSGTLFRIQSDGSGFEVLRHFGQVFTDGSAPAGPPALLDGILFGATSFGGSASAGTLYRIQPDGGNFSILHEFGLSPEDGIGPLGLVAAGDGPLFGVTTSGNGAAFFGTVFRIETNGLNFSTVATFDLAAGGGIQPLTGLTAQGGTVFGTTGGGGAEGLGTVFKVDSTGGPVTTLASLRSFDLTGGSQPDPVLLEWNGLLYGTVMAPASWHLFRLTPDGTAFEILMTRTDHHPRGPLTAAAGMFYWMGFGSSPGASPDTLCRVNSDGSGFTIVSELPLSGLPGRTALTASGTVLYGSKPAPVTTSSEWQLFKINSDGSGFTVLRTFPATRAFGSLLVDGSTVYGTTLGTSAHGTVFRIGTGGGGFAQLKQFRGADGSQPMGSLVLRGTTLFGTTRNGGSAGAGVVYRINTNGGGFKVITHFSGDIGGLPEAGLTQFGGSLYGFSSWGFTESGISVQSSAFQIDANTETFHTLAVLPGQTGATGAPVFINHRLYATAERGGDLGFGSVFAVDTTPPLDITSTEGGIVVSWPAYAAEFDLQSTITLGANWSPVAGTIVIENMRRSITLPATPDSQYFRLQGR